MATAKRKISDEFIRRSINHMMSITLLDHGLLICGMSGTEPTLENVFKAIGPLLNPADPDFDLLATAIGRRHDEVGHAVASFKLDSRGSPK